MTESNMVLDPDTGELREVDVTVEIQPGTLAAATLLVECRDHKRSQTVEWIDQLIGKHMKTAGSAVVAVSKSGFTNAARRKALRHNILPLSIEEAFDTTWLAEVRAYPLLKITFCQPKLQMVDVKLIDKSLTTADFPTLKMADVDLRRSNGERIGTALDLYEELDQADAVVAALHNNQQRRQDGLVELGCRLEDGSYFNTPEGAVVQVEGVTFVVEPNEELVELDVKAGTYGPASVATGLGGTPSWRVQFAVVRGQDGRPKLSLSIQPASGRFPPGVLKLYGIPD